MKRFALATLLAATVLFSGCASTHTMLRVGVGYDVTDFVNGCDRKLDLGCGLKGPRDLALLELLYAPGLSLRSTVEPYCSWLHTSHYSAGVPVNSKFEQFLDAPNCGAFIQFGERR